MDEKKKYTKHSSTRYRTQKGVPEVHKSMWIRKDVLAAAETFIEEYKAKFGKRLFFKELINEALYNTVLRKRQEELHGQSVKFQDTEVDPITGETKRKSI